MAPLSNIKLWHLRSNARHNNQFLNVNPEKWISVGDKFETASWPCLGGHVSIYC